MKLPIDPDDVSIRMELPMDPSDTELLCRQRKLARNAALKGKVEFNDSFSECCNATQDDPYCVAPFDKDEIILGRHIGSGSFSHVYEIVSFNLCSHTATKFSEEEIEKREFMAQQTAGSSTAKYVLKHIKPQLERSPIYPYAARDIAIEAEMLSSLDHPNIIKIDGMSSSQHDAFLGGSNEFFIILERLYETMSDRIKYWSKQTSKKKRNLSQTSPDLTQSLMKTQISISASLASAMDYLHQNNILFRDLKPDNIGINYQGNVKLFDFGIARVLPPLGCVYTDVFEMPGAGTPGYSPPEMLAMQPYNAKADVYSFAVVFWQILSLERPFPAFRSRKKFVDAVVFGGKRPKIDPRWPEAIKEIIRNGFSSDINQRPTMNEFLCTLHQCLSEERDDDFIRLQKLNVKNIWRVLSTESPSLFATIKRVLKQHKQVKTHQCR